MLKTLHYEVIIDFEGEVVLKIMHIIFISLCVLSLTACSSTETFSGVTEEAKQYQEEIQTLNNEVERLNLDNRELEKEITELDIELQQVKEDTSKKISELEVDMMDKDKLIEKYKYEEELYDTYDTVPNMFMLGLMQKDFTKMNEILSDNMEIKETDGSIYVYENNEIIAFIGKTKFEATNYTIHGFNYVEKDEMFIVYAQIFYEDNGEFVSPPTYIDLGFKVNNLPLYPITIDWVSRDV